MDKLYNAHPDGYVETRSKWANFGMVRFSALGFYPVCPGSNEYVIGSPLFNKMTVKLENGNTIRINASTTVLRIDILRNCD